MICDHSNEVLQRTKETTKNLQFCSLSDVPARAVFHNNTQRYVRFLRASGELVE